MDKLEPLIRHRFWVLFGLSIPLALVGYFMASGEMRAATSAQEESLKKTLDGVPKGVTEPNDKYSAGLQVINDALQAENKVEVQKLWEAQTTRMDWPTVMVKNNYIPNEYRGEMAEAARRYYTRIYGKVIQRAWEKAQPMVDDPPPPGLEVTWPKKLYLLPETIPVHQFHTTMSPTSKQVWDAQEDVWLLELIFEGIARANAEATWIGNAPVRRIDQLLLTGGSGTPAVLEAPSTGGGGFGIGDYDDEGDRDSVTTGLFGGGAGGRRPGGAVGAGSVSFSPAEEFGNPLPDPEDEAAAAAAAAAAGGGGGFGGYEEEDDRGGGASLLAGRMGGGYRYIGDPATVETQPYRERGFYVSAIVMLPELPGIFADLSSSDWPIRVLRFQIGPNPYAVTSSGGYAPGGFGAGRGGFGRGGREEDDYDMNRPSSFGMGGFGQGGALRAFAGIAGSGSSFSGLGGLGRGGVAGGMGSVTLPIAMRGPQQMDPNWFADPELVQVDFCGIITMYNPQTSDTVVPESDGSSAEETDEVIAAREAADRAAAEEAAAAAQAAAEAEAANQAATEGVDGDADAAGAGSALPADAVPASDADGATDGVPVEQTPDETPSGGDESPEETNSE